MSMARHFCLALFVLATTGGPVVSDQPGGGNVAAAKKRFADAPDSQAAGKEIDSILKAAQGNLSPLLADDNTSISLFAAWDSAKLRGNTKDGSDWYWFIGFLQ